MAARYPARAGAHPRALLDDLATAAAGPPIRRERAQRQQEQARAQLLASGTDRFARLAWRATPGGAVLLDGASAGLECIVDQPVCTTRMRSDDRAK
jgi:flavin reductase (DIM6/NTAB) family NADH-FMN oxidoreductase RutF